MGFIIVITCIMACLLLVSAFFMSMANLLENKRNTKELCIVALAALVIGMSSHTLNNYENQAQAWKVQAGLMTNQASKLESKNAHLKSIHKQVSESLVSTKADLRDARQAVTDKSFKLAESQSNLGMQKIEVSLLQAELKTERGKAKADQRIVETLTEANETLKLSNEALQGKLDAINEAVGGSHE